MSWGGEEKNIRDWKVDNGGVLLHKEIVLGEPLDAEDKVRRQLGELEALEEVLLIGFVFLKEKKQQQEMDFNRNLRASSRTLLPQMGI